MKSKKVLYSILVTLLAAVLFSLCMTCLLELAGIALGAAIDSDILREYPRFLPFCLAVGFLAAVLLGITVWLTAKRKDGSAGRSGRSPRRSSLPCFFPCRSSPAGRRCSIFCRRDYKKKPHPVGCGFYVD